MTILPYCHTWDAAISNLLDQSMGSGRYARTAERLREHNHKIDEACFVMLDEVDDLRASISFWPLLIGDVPALLLGPLAVRPIDQGKGYGQTLMAHALSVIDERMPQPVLLVGDEPYYRRAGFGVISEQVSLPGPVDRERLLVRSHQIPASEFHGRVVPASYLLT